MESMDEGFRQQLLAVEEMKEIAVNNARKEAGQLRIACESRVAEVSLVVHYNSIYYFSLFCSTPA
ncbi:unnamed protein product [Trichobilharzia regenti]|nr:unnamed protein product [Trichobilharzia regenti]